MTDRNPCHLATAPRSLHGTMAGEYVSVSSQSDTEKADLEREHKELRENPDFELDELTGIFINRGVDQGLARQVVQQLMAKDALSAHARDELGISEITPARPVQAALTSALMFSVGAAMPLLMVIVSPAGALVPIVSAASLGFLALLGGIGARAGGANVRATTVAEHMPSSHRRLRDRTHERIRRDAASIGTNPATLIDLILAFQAAFGARGWTGHRHHRSGQALRSRAVNAACARALVLDTRSYTSVAAVLKNHAEEAASEPNNEGPRLDPFQHPRSRLLQLTGD
jgi:hypothetical protein